MSGLSNALVQGKVHVLFGPATVSADGAGGSASKIENRDGFGLLILQTAAGTGTTPTLDVKLQQKEKTGDALADVPGVALDQMVAAGGIKTKVVDLRSLKLYVQGYFDIGGTSTPTFPGTSLLLIEIPKYTSGEAPPDWITAL